MTSSPKPLQPHENALAVYLKRHRSRYLSHVREIWAEGYGMDRVCLTDIASALYALCERLDLLEHSVGSFPGGRGGFGVLCDAAPVRVWAMSLSLDGAPAEDDPELEQWAYWARIIGVLCSRIRMANVDKLPGYTHDVTVGPFRYDAEGWPVPAAKAAEVVT